MTTSSDTLNRLLIEFDSRGRLSDEQHLKAFQKIADYVASEQRQLVDRFKDELTKIHPEELTYGSVMKAMETALLNKIRKEL